MKSAKKRVANKENKPRLPPIPHVNFFYYQLLMHCKNIGYNSLPNVGGEMQKNSLCVCYKSK